MTTKTPAKAPFLVDAFLKSSAKDRSTGELIMCDQAFPLPCRIPVHVGLFFDGTNNTTECDLFYRSIVSAFLPLGARPMKWLVSLICVFLLSGCVTAQQKAQDAVAGAQVGVVNHTGKYIYSSSIDGVPNGDRPIVGGGSGGNMNAWGAGGAGICCASIPRVWYPGMKVLVQWNMPEGIKDVIKEKIVEVEKYDETGSIYLHFFPNDEVRVVITSAAGWSSAHPIPPPVKPAPTPQSK